MQNDIYLIGEVGYEITLDSVIQQVQNTDNTKPLNVHIHSGGGSVYDGLAIYNYFKTLPQKVNTISSGLVASIASIIYLAGDKETRKINSTDSFLIHLPSGMDWGNADDLEKTAKELRNIESKLSKIYANETSLTEVEAMELMKKDEMMNVNFLKEKGFVSDIVEFKAVANFNNKNPKNKQMKNENLSEKDKSWFTTMFAKFGKNEPVNKIVQDAQGADIDFYELEDTDVVKVGDKAKIDGKAADGSYLMPDDKGTYVFVNEELTEIQKEDAGGDDTEALQKKIADLEEQLQASATQTQDAQAKVTEKDTLINSMTSDMEKIKAKVTSSFNWDGKQEKKDPEEKVARIMKRKNK